MARTTPKMLLQTWDQVDDDYNFEQLANNFNLIDYHDHSPGRGVPLGPGSVGLGALTFTPLIFNSGSLEGLPGTAEAGSFYYASDVQAMYQWNGSAWKMLVTANEAIDPPGNYSAQEGDVIYAVPGSIITLPAPSSCRLPVTITANSAVTANNPVQITSTIIYPLGGIPVSSIYLYTNVESVTLSPNGSAWVVTSTGLPQAVYGQSESGSVDVLQGMTYSMNGGAVAYLPSAKASVQPITIWASSVSGDTPLPIVTTASGDVISGTGLASGGQNEILLGSPGAFVTLTPFPNGVWVITGGQQDTGWVALTLGSGITNPGIGNYPPGSKLVGDRVYLRGLIQAVSGYTSGGTIFSLGSYAHSPQVNTVFPNVSIVNSGSTGTGGILQIAASAITVNCIINMGSGGYMSLDGASYSVI